MGVRLDSFYVGKVVFSQLDMPMVPSWRDTLMYGGSFRRGTITLRGDHGILQVERNSGEALDVFLTLNKMADVRKVTGVRPVDTGGAELGGLCPGIDLTRPDEA